MSEAPSFSADRSEVAKFVQALFRYADSGTFASIRAFDQFDRSLPPTLIRGEKINGNLDNLAGAACVYIDIVGKFPRPVVFAPPIATFADKKRARAGDVANGLSISVEMDSGDTLAELKRLEGLLGPVTIAMKSGGEWINPATGEIHDKLHAHWRLSEPTRDKDDHEKLVHARRMAAALVGADPTGAPVAHPYRWPGSWNLKSERPIMANIVRDNPDAEVNLVEGIDALEDAIEQAGLKEDAGTPRSNDDPQAPVTDLLSAIQAIPNANADVGYGDWVRLGYAVWAATGGSGAGFTMWDEWSQKSSKYDAKETQAVWRRISAAQPRKIGAGTIFYAAKQAGWVRPKPASKEEEPTEESTVATTKVKAEAKDPSEPKPDDTRPEWLKCLQRDEGGNAIPNLANAALALRQAPALVGLIAFDEMQRTTMVMRNLPDSRLAKVPNPRGIADADVSAIQEYLQRNELRRLGKETVHQACELVAIERAFHPVKRYLNRLKWDRTKRLETWLSSHLGTDNSEYNAQIGKMFLISMVARIMQPGCQCDYMMILEDRQQGTMKSSACGILAGEWFSDALPDLHGNTDWVRVSMHLRGKWLLEISDLSAFSRAEAETLKAFITSKVEQYTPKYGRNEVVEPRQCVFIGTTNKTEYLRDDTGARRFWPTKTNVINLDTLARDRDQLFAEAMWAYQQKAPWWPDRTFEATEIKPQQDARFEVDEWESPILEKIPGMINPTLTDIANQALGLGTDKLGTREQRRIAAILDRAGWTRGTRTATGRPWVPPEKTLG
jgi:predicted P-loop ATPase